MMLENTLPERQLRILLVLREHREGLTCLEIFSYLVEKFDNSPKLKESLKDAADVSSYISFLRSKGLVKTARHFSPHVHDITDKGINLLTQLEEERMAGIDNNQEPVKIQTVDDIYAQIEKERIRYDKEMHSLLSRLIKEENKPVIENKDDKITVLIDLAPQFNSKISNLLNAIRQDLENLST